MGRVLKLPQNQLMPMRRPPCRVQSEPDLFGFSPEAMQATMEGIADLCGLRVTQVPELVAAQPRIMLQVTDHNSWVPELVAAQPRLM